MLRVLMSIIASAIALAASTASADSCPQREISKLGAALWKIDNDVVRLERISNGPQRTVKLGLRIATLGESIEYLDIPYGQAGLLVAELIDTDGPKAEGSRIHLAALYDSNTDQLAILKRGSNPFIILATYERTISCAPASGDELMPILRTIKKLGVPISHKRLGVASVESVLESLGF